MKRCCSRAIRNSRASLAGALWLNGKFLRAHGSIKLPDLQMALHSFRETSSHNSSIFDFAAYKTHNGWRRKPAAHFVNSWPRFDQRTRLWKMPAQIPKMAPTAKLGAALNRDSSNSPSSAPAVTDPSAVL